MTASNPVPAGTKVRTLYEHSETGTIINPPKASLPLPGPDWHVVKFDVDGVYLCIHRSMFSISNQRDAEWVAA